MPLTLGALIWAAVGKDPGFSPMSLLELLRRRGKIRPDELARLHLVQALDVEKLKVAWLAALESAERFIRARPPEEVGCLYFSPTTQSFVDPDQVTETVMPHYGRPGGVVPRVVE